MTATRSQSLGRFTKRMPRLFWAVRAQDEAQRALVCQGSEDQCLEEVVVARPPDPKLQEELLEGVAQALARGEVPPSLRVAQPVEPEFTLTPDMIVAERGPRPRPAEAAPANVDGAGSQDNGVYGDPATLARHRRSVVLGAITVAALVAAAALVAFAWLV